MSSSARCELLPWDSQFFGFPIARLASGPLDEPAGQLALEWCRQHDVRCLYYLASPDDPAAIATAENHGFRLVDVRVELDRPIEPGGASPPLRTATSEDLPRLRELATAEHRVTRFYQDAHFSREACDELYRRWITESLGAFADVVLVVGEGCHVEGYVTVRTETGGNARIGLIAVDHDARGRGHGGRLIQGALDFASSRGAQKAAVATQARNIEALRLYERYQFRIARVGLWYHKWFGT